MKKRNLTIAIMIISVLFAIGYHKIQSARVNVETAISFFVKHDVNLDTYKLGIDFSKPVRILHVKKGDKFIQYQIPGAPQGNFYALEGTTPSELGISEWGYDSEYELTVKKRARIYIATKDFKVLASYAAAVVDDWSTPEDETQTDGSKLQLFTTCKPCFQQKGIVYEN